MGHSMSNQSKYAVCQEYKGAKLIILECARPEYKVAKLIILEKYDLSS